MPLDAPSAIPLFDGLTLNVLGGLLFLVGFVSMLLGLTKGIKDTQLQGARQFLLGAVAVSVAGGTLFLARVASGKPPGLELRNILMLMPLLTGILVLRLRPWSRTAEAHIRVDEEGLNPRERRLAEQRREAAPARALLQAVMIVAVVLVAGVTASYSGQRFSRRLEASNALQVSIHRERGARQTGPLQVEVVGEVPRVHLACRMFTDTAPVVDGAATFDGFPEEDCRVALTPEARPWGPVAAGQRVSCHLDGGETRCRAALTDGPGSRVIIRGRHAGAANLDGRPLGRLPAEAPLQAGSHRLQIALDDGRSGRWTFRSGLGDTVVVLVGASEAVSGLTSEPSGAPTAVIPSGRPPIDIPSGAPPAD